MNKPTKTSAIEEACIVIDSIVSDSIAFDSIQDTIKYLETIATSCDKIAQNLRSQFSIETTEDCH